ncbi:MAG: hypothetical protein AAFV85_17900 [Cyanobacteria bacterium J06634_6]
MFDSSSRYYSLQQATYTTAAGQKVAYVRRRFLPPADTMQTLSEVTLNESDRIDTIAARTLGNSQQYWHICDANNAMNPSALTAEPGRKLRVALPPVT